MDITEKKDILKKVSLFSYLADEILLEIAGKCVEQKVDHDKELFKIDDPTNGLYIVVKGQILITKGEKEVGKCGPGDFVGEISILDKGPRAANAIATEDCLLLLLPVDDFEQFMIRFPRISKLILKSSLDYLQDVIF